jgi:acetylornithine deacetylase/succinyl-diaminopimelate desuccinylase-like protein
MQILDRLDQLAALGDRIGYSPEEDAAHALATGWFREAGLEVEVDAAGNLIGRIPGGTREVWTGSHLDTVPAAGRFDGTLGVVAGIEAVERLGTPGLGVVVFRDEERGCAGSRGCTARPDAFVELHIEQGPTLLRADAPLGVVVFRDEERGCAGSRGCTARPDAFVELHIEQGPTLLRADAPLGVVTAIVGYVRGRRTFEGNPGHAGTTPMDVREDALVTAAEFVLHAREVAGGIGGAVATVGQVTVEPGGTNVIPGRVVVSVDARAPDAERLDRLAAALQIEEPIRTEPSPMSEEIRAALRAEVEALGLPVLELPSGAGHDAGILASAGIPAGMLFVRSLNGGVSHNPAELSSPEDIVLAADALTGALRRLVA